MTQVGFLNFDLNIIFVFTLCAQLHTVFKSQLNCYSNYEYFFHKIINFLPDLSRHLKKGIISVWATNFKKKSIYATWVTNKIKEIV